MVNVFDACKEIGAEEFYESFVYDDKKRMVYVINLGLKKRDIKTFLNYIEKGISLQTVGIASSENSKTKEYFPIAEYTMKGQKIITNKNPEDINPSHLETLINKKRNCQRAAEYIRKEYLEPVIESLKRSSSEDEFDECGCIDDEF